MAQTCLFLGLLAIVVVDKVLELLGKDSEDVVTELQHLQDALGVGIIDPEAPRILERIRGRPLHHYHLSKDKNGDATWFYQVVSFKGSPSAGKLTATASFVPTEGAAEKDHKYQIEASVESSHLVVKTRRVDRSPDIGIEVFRDAGRSTASLFPLYGVKILTTWWEDELASSISILSDVPLVRGAKDGAPLTNAGTLQAEWERRSRIARLPLTPPAPMSPGSPLKQGVTIEQKWNENRVVELLQNSPLNADIRIFVSFFVTDVDLFELLGRLLTNSKRKITIMMLDPDAPVLEMRYGTEDRKIRESITATSAREKIVSQLHDLAELRKMLRRLANDALRDSKQRDLGTLEVRVYRCAPTLVSYHTQEEMLVGILLLHKSANAGPMIRVDRGEPLWQLIEDNWRTVLRVSEERIGAGV